MGMSNSITFTTISNTPLPFEGIEKHFNDFVENAHDGSWKDYSTGETEASYSFNSKWEVGDLAEKVRKFTATNPTVNVELREEWNEEEPSTTVRNFRRGKLFRLTETVERPVLVKAGAVIPYDPALAIQIAEDPSLFTEQAITKVIKELLFLNGVTP